MINIKQSGIINGHKWVDMGLSVKWATCNVGASSPSDTGAYFAWGETEPNSEYTWESYKFRVSGKYSMATFNKYMISCERKQGDFVQQSQFSWGYMPSVKNEQSAVDNKTKLDMSDDAARTNWGGTWRMPTREELEELTTRCSWELTIQEDKSGYKVTSNNNGNFIFLPLSGLWMDGKFYDGVGHCWSSSLRTEAPYTAYGIEFGYSHIFESDMIGWTSESRCFGLSVRPVSD